MTDWVGSDNGIDPHSLAEVLFKIGLIGLSREQADPIYYCNGNSFSQTWGRVSHTPIVHIHPAFRKVLDVSGAALHRPWRAKRARRVDPRQLAFDEAQEGNGA